MKGEKLLELALLTAKAELALGRKTAPSIVVTFIDGAPLSNRKSQVASKAIRKSARLIYVPVVGFAPLKNIKKWATRRWQENVVKVKDAQELGKEEVATHLVANVCPSLSQQLKAMFKKW